MVLEWDTVSKTLKKQKGMMKETSMNGFTEAVGKTETWI